MYGIRRQFQYLLVLLPVILLPFSHSVVAADATSTVAASNVLATDILNYEEQLADLESRFGPYHRSLLEPLQSLTELAAEQADFTRVAELQNRQLQVMRTVLGFRHPELVPLLHEIVTNEIRLQNWEAVSDHLEHIRYLVAAEANNDPTVLLETMSQQAYWHLARVYLDRSELRARNFMQARELTAEMLELAQSIFDEESQQLIPWLYESALNEYRLVALMNADDGIAADTIERLIREEGIARLQTFGRNRIDVGSLLGNRTYIPIVADGELVGEAYLRDARYILEDIGEIAEQAGDLEGQAMALIYEGDLQRVMDESIAFRKYRDARTLLLEAGISNEKIELYFNRPALIPLPEIFLRLDDALAYQQQRMAGITISSADQLHLGQFIAWQHGLPNVPKPVAVAEFLNVEPVYSYVDATLSVSSSGNISSVKVIAAYPDERNVEREAVRAIRKIKVRPAIVEGRARRTRDVHIRYLFLPKE